jgi:hypothetical protein
MTTDQAQRFIVLATFVTLGSTVSNVLKKPKGQKEELHAHRVIAGGFFAMMGCAILAEFDTDVGVGLATLVAGGAFFKYGLPVLNEGFGQEKGKRIK